jgi:hypothetical protein
MQWGCLMAVDSAIETSLLGRFTTVLLLSHSFSLAQATLFAIILN